MPPQAQNKWQRKHNQYVMNVLQLKPKSLSHPTATTTRPTPIPTTEVPTPIIDIKPVKKAPKRVAFAFDVSIPICKLNNNPDT